MANSKNIKWFDPYVTFYFVVYNGKRSGIYTDFEEARYAAWHSDELVDKYKTLKAARTAFRRYIGKHKST